MEIQSISLQCSITTSSLSTSKGAIFLQVAFVMDGKYGVLEYMKKRIEKNGICVVVVAEGAGQVFQVIQKNMQSPTTKVLLVLSTILEKIKNI